MDRALKERIVGAIVLVAVVVLVVPVFLDGPPDNAVIRSDRVPLPGQDEQKTQTVVLERDREQPVPASATTEPSPAQREPAAAAKPVPDKPTAEAQKAAAKPEPGKSPSIEKTTAPTFAAASTTGMWAVQLGSFSEQANAERLAADLRKQGFAAFLSQLSTPNGRLHRVRVGPQKDRQAAEAMAARLKKAGHSGQVLPHP